MFTFELDPLEDGTFGYRVFEDGVIRIYQPFAPGLPGYTPMSESEATAYAQADILQLDPPA